MLGETMKTIDRGEAFKQYQRSAVDASKFAESSLMWRTVALLGMQCCLAANTGQLVRFIPEKGGYGSNWPDATDEDALDPR